jgi:hypothetical protein
LPCNSSTAITEAIPTQRKLVKITDVLGRNANIASNTHLFYIYDDGSVEQNIIIN